MMKRTLALIAAALLLIAVFAACGKKADTDSGSTAAQQTQNNNTEAQNNTEVQNNTEAQDAATEADSADESFADALAAYKKPAEAVSIDLTAEDPSTDEITFDFNEDGSIKSCVFAANGYKYRVSYREVTDSDTPYLQIYVFTEDGTVVAADVVKINGAYDPAVGFAEKDGYFLKGYSF